MIFAPQELYLLPFETIRQREVVLPDAAGLLAGLIQAVAELKAVEFVHAKAMITLFARSTKIVLGT